jgi:glycosyltransferase involved in cell wall biosynthesis
VNTHTALAILTYVDSDRPASVRRRLQDAITSLEKTGYRDPVMIVDDGSSCREHLRYLDGLARDGRYEVIRRLANGGISRAKNTCLRAIAEREPRIGFLAEDDILFHEGWDQAYVEAMSRTGVQHFSWYLPDADNQVVACNGGLVAATRGILGLLLTFTPDVLARVGGFKVLPRRWGYEHIQWTHRNVIAGFAPFAADIPDSSRFIERNTLPSSVDDAEMQAGLSDNLSGLEVEQLYEPLEE